MTWGRAKSKVKLSQEVWPLWSLPLDNPSLQFQALSQTGFLPGVWSPTLLLTLDLFSLVHTSSVNCTFPTQSHFHSFTSSLHLSFHLPAGSQFTHTRQSMHITIEIVGALRKEILINLYWSYAKGIFKLQFGQKFHAHEQSFLAPPCSCLGH